jgi:hypothetical protein
MIHRYHRHERISRAIAGNPAAQTQLERRRLECRDFIQDCIDFVEGRETEGATRAKAEADRLRKRTSEAKRRAMVGADPLNITGHTTGKAARRETAAPPVEFVGTISRVIPSTERLTGKNKLDRQQRLAAEHYREAFETIRSQLGGSMDFDRPRGGGFAPAGFAEVILIANQTLKQARALLGARTIIIVEQVVCHGKTAQECTRLVYGYADGDKVAARDSNHVARMLREALTELGQSWFPANMNRRPRIYRPADSRPTEINPGPLDNSQRSYVG